MAYKQKSSPLNKGVRDAETMNTPIDNRMGNVTYGSWMSQHSKSAINYGSPLYSTLERIPEETAKVTYEDAYKKRSDTYKGLNLADFTAEAKRQNTSKAEGKGWDAPKTKMTSSVSGGNTAGDISKIEEGRDLVTAGKATKKRR